MCEPVRDVWETSTWRHCGAQSAGERLAPASALTARPRFRADEEREGILYSSREAGYQKEQE